MAAQNPGPNLRQSLNDLLKLQPDPNLLRAAPDRRPFSAFHMADSMRANALTVQFHEIAMQTMSAATGTYAGKQVAAVSAVLADAQARIKNGDEPEFVKHALKMFVIHHPLTVGLRIDGLEERDPHLVAPSHFAMPTAAALLDAPPAEAPETDTMPASAADNGPEQVLAWFREDPKLNEHHEHWHLVYPIAGSPLTGKPIERQGELFWYMHEQMLARYDTERMAAGLPPVQPWLDYHDTWSEQYGYYPGDVFLANGWAKRTPGQQWSFEENPPGLLGTANLPTQEKWRDNLTTAAETGLFQMRGEAIPVNTDNLGAAIESDRSTIDQAAINTYWFATTLDPVKDKAQMEQVTWQLRNTTYGQLHNAGHDLFGVGPSGQLGPAGVMASTVTSCRDPIFWRWHRHIDLLHYQWEEQWLAPRNFTDDAPANVTITGDDILLAFEEKIGADVTDEQARQWAADVFAGKRAGAITDKLITQMLKRTINAEGGIKTMPPTEIEYLDQKPFAYFYRLHNSGITPKNVTLRVYLAPTAAAENRRMWIEMDKFTHVAQPGTSIVYRPARLSSVIKKPAVKPPDGYQKGQKYQWWPIDPNANAPALNDNYCDCGWPYNLLLPRGTAEGMDFKLLVMLTDADQDLVPREDCECGSMSFCGSKQKYPDTKPMGYPFHAPFKGSILTTFQALPQAAVRDLTIRFVQ
jgi:tyrosinase